MPLYRGGMYAAPLDPDVDAWLVVTNDDWNEHMDEVAAVPIGRMAAEPPLPHSVQIRLGDATRTAVSGAITSLPTDELGPYLQPAGREGLGAVEACMADLLDLPLLLSAPARALPVVGATARYPMWGEVYYGPPKGGGSLREHKRYVVVSNNAWNATMSRVVAVRLTTSPRRAGPGFPAIGSRDVKACCGNVGAIRSGALDVRRRPMPPSLALRDMVAIADGIADTLELPR